jgi:hypothetical protein
MSSFLQRAKEAAIQLQQQAKIPGASSNAQPSTSSEGESSRNQGLIHPQNNSK